MTTIDYTTYTIEQLLDAKSCIDKEAYPDNYKALINELEARNFNINDYHQQQIEQKINSAIKRVKIVGIFQLLAVVAIPLYLLILVSSGQSFNAGVYIIAFVIIVFNGFAGWTAYKAIEKYYWVSILNQSLQLFSFGIGSVLMNYSGLGGIYTIFKWGEDAGFQFSATFSPGFNLHIFHQPLPSGYFSIDIMAIIFLTALVTVLNRKPQLTSSSSGTAKPHAAP